MMRRRSLQLATIAGTLLVPLALRAGASSASVTVAPFGVSAAPAMSLILLGFLALVLTASAAYVLRRRSTLAAAAALVGTVMVTGIGYAAFITIPISGDECLMETTKPYFPGGMVTLHSNCDNDIVITDITVTCVNEEAPLAEVPPSCEVGTVLNPGDDCLLPLCES